VNFSAVSLLEPSTEHGPEVFTPSELKAQVGSRDTLLLYHKGNVVKGARVDKWCWISDAKEDWNVGSAS